MLRELNEQIANQNQAMRLHEEKPELFCVSTAGFDTSLLFRQMQDILRRQEENLKIQQSIIDIPKFVVSGDYIPFDYIRYNPNLGPELKPYCKIELFPENEKETEKMDAKRCDRCGKLYDADEAQNCVYSYMPGKYVSKYEKENYTDAKIRQDHTSSISVMYYANKTPVDLCPECREKLKNFFESGKGETNVIKKAEE